MQNVTSRLLPSESFLAGKLLSSRVYPEFFPFSGNERVVNLGFGDGPQAIIYSGSFSKMIGVEIQSDRAQAARERLQRLGIDKVEIINASVEAVPLPDQSADKILAIDIIEHVQHPDQVFAEAKRLLVSGGLMLITYPAMHDAYEHFFGALGKILKPWKKRKAHGTEWHPDEHAHDKALNDWMKIADASGLKLVETRATTMFPPIHLYGVPRFWFSVNWIHAIDRWFCKRKSIQRFGQTVMAIYEKA